jgi:glycosyltransferase involved in cell wall biosynthesis
MPPKFSIITIVYNGASLIEGTMQSVFNQTLTDYEYLIIDGNSKDKTIDIVKDYAQRYPLSLKWISETDKGLYDAMNKGLKMANGEYVLFLNCGDHLFEPTTLEKMASKAEPNTDVLYGETMLVNDNREHLGTRTDLTVQKLPPQLKWQNLRFGMVVCHQSFLPKRAIAPYYIENNLAADIDWVIKCLKKSKKTVFTDTIISEYLVGGVSKERHLQSLKDRYEILKNHYGWLPNLLAHGWIIVRAVLSKLNGRVKY